MRSSGRAAEPSWRGSKLKLVDREWGKGRKRKEKKSFITLPRITRDTIWLKRTGNRD
jgi:hypothetical protein